MAQIVKLRRSAVTGRKPTNAQLELGELSINTTDGKVFLAKSGSLGPSIEEIITTNSVNTGSLNIVGAVTASQFSGSFNGDGTNILNVVSSSYAVTSSYSSLAFTVESAPGTTQKMEVPVEESTWTFNHNIGEQFPNIQVFDYDGNVVIPSRIYAQDSNTAIIDFTYPQRGYVTATVGGGLPAISPSYNGRILQTDGVGASWNTINGMGFATTGSNSFNGNQTITGSLNVSTNTVVTGSLTVSGTISTPNRPAFRVTGNGGTTSAVTVLSGSATSVDFNQGNHWNNTNGTFTAPVAGLYQVNIVCRIYSNSNVSSQVAIVKNNTSGTNGVVMAFIEWAANTTMNHAGAGSVVRLEVGDTLKAIVFLGQVSFDGNDNFSVAYIG